MISLKLRLETANGTPLGLRHPFCLPPQWPPPPGTPILTIVSAFVYTRSQTFINREKSRNIH
jgi:hypothetical protein